MVTISSNKHFELFYGNMTKCKNAQLLYSVIYNLRVDALFFSTKKLAKDFHALSKFVDYIMPAVLF